jgi:Transport and Golgi organisation 2
MCTLSFYPKPTEKGAFILTFSRDEQPNRSSVEVVKDAQRGVIFPKDVLHGGSWLAMSERTGRVTCLLNGAFKLHERQLPYRKSRGLVLLESFDYDEPIDFCEQYNFHNIEPFTMLLLENKQFIELRWDGLKRHIRLLSQSIPQIWSSFTLYDPSVQSRRKRWFYDFLDKNLGYAHPDDIWQFHKTEQKDDPENGILMRRPSGVQTVSLTQLIISNQSQTIKFQYNELGNKNTDRRQIVFGHAAVLDTEGVC